MTTSGGTAKPFATLQSASSGLSKLAEKAGFAQAGTFLSIAAGAFTVVGIASGEKTPEEEILDAVNELGERLDQLEGDLNRSIDASTRQILDTLRDLWLAETLSTLKDAEYWLTRATRLAREVSAGTVTPTVARATFAGIVHTDNDQIRSETLKDLLETIPRACDQASQHFADLYARHGGNAVELALLGSEVSDLVTTAIAYYCLLSAPSRGLTHAQPGTLILRPELQVHLERFELSFEAMRQELQRLLTLCVRTADDHVRKEVLARLATTKSTAASLEADAEKFLHAPPSKLGASDGGLVLVWPWLDFVVFAHEPSDLSTCQAPVGPPRSPDPPPGYGSQWTHLVSHDAGSHVWFVAWSPRLPSDAASGSILDAYRWRWPNPVTHAPMGDPLTAGEHAWKLLTGADGWPAEHWSPTPRLGFSDDDRTRLDAFVLTYARTLNPYEIARRFPSMMTGAGVPLAHLAYWNGQTHHGWGYTLTQDEKNLIKWLDSAEVDRSPNLNDYGTFVANRAFTLASTDPGRVHLWGPRLMRRARSRGFVGWTQIGAAVYLA